MVDTNLCRVASHEVSGDGRAYSRKAVIFLKALACIE